MYLLGLLSCVLFAIVPGYAVTENNESVVLKWPIKYTFEAEKISLTAGLVEDIQFWRTKFKSRVDYNNGAVKYISAKPRWKSNYLFGVKYETYPETTEEKENYIVCKRTNGTIENRITLDEILPDSYRFKHAGSEVFDQDVVEKFYCSEEDEEQSTTKTIWATYKPNNNYWIPIRYEYIEYEMWTSTKKAHNIWNIQNFNTNFNSTLVFEVENSSNCQDSETESGKLTNSRNDNIDPENKTHMGYAFNLYKKKYNKVYANKKEHFLRRNIFEKNMKLINENNNKNTGYKLAINKFADRTPQEMKKYRGLIRPSQRESDTHPFPYTRAVVKELAKNLPLEFDLRDLGIISPAKDQEECGSCWTFGTTSAVEGALARKNGGRLIRLSNQAVLDCAWGYNTSGCDGGYDIGAYRWMIDHGLPSEEEYGPYANKDGFCHIHNMTNIYPIRGFTNVTPYSVEALKVAIVNHGPLSVSIHATDFLPLYKSGIYYDIYCEPNNLNHEVTLVGYAQRDGEEYWIVKNSWGQTWGIDGYFHLSVRDNNCGITTEPSYPVL